MARSSIGTISNDLQTDTGSVLWSIVQGEQLEFPIVLNFLENAGAGYSYEAVVMEAANIAGDSTPPVDVRLGGVNTTLTVRVPADKGAWASTTAYSREDVVSYAGVYYKLKSGNNLVNATLPTADTNWELYTPNQVYVQFPATLSTLPAWAVQPNSVSPVHGFFELRVTEPSGGVFTRTWKPMRGLIEILFSPTNLVA
jgi:hypothetical protein